MRAGYVKTGRKNLFDHKGPHGNSIRRCITWRVKLPSTFQDSPSFSSHILKALLLRHHIYVNSFSVFIRVSSFFTSNLFLVSARRLCRFSRLFLCSHLKIRLLRKEAIFHKTVLLLLLLAPAFLFFFHGFLFLELLARGRSLPRRSRIIPTGPLREEKRGNKRERTPESRNACARPIPSRPIQYHGLSTQPEYYQPPM